jgi:hypothetical protein
MTYFNFLFPSLCVTFKVCPLFFIHFFYVGFDLICQARVVCGQKGSPETPATDETVLSICIDIVS